MLNRSASILKTAPLPDFSNPLDSDTASFHKFGENTSHHTYGNSNEFEIMKQRMDAMEKKSSTMGSTGTVAAFLKWDVRFDAGERALRKTFIKRNFLLLFFRIYLWKIFEFISTKDLFGSLLS